MLHRKLPRVYKILASPDPLGHTRPAPQFLKIVGRRAILKSSALSRPAPRGAVVAAADPFEHARGSTAGRGPRTTFGSIADSALQLDRFRCIIFDMNGEDLFLLGRTLMKLGQEAMREDGDDGSGP